MTTWYIAGPMTGLPDYNYPAFHAAEAMLRERFPGDTIINPATQFGGDQTLPREVYLRRAVENVARADALFLLPGWQRSRGACVEVVAAHACGAALAMRAEDDDPVDTYAMALTSLFLMAMGA